MQAPCLQNCSFSTTHNHLTPPNNRTRFDYNLPSTPALVAWTKSGPGHTLSADALASCADADQSGLLLRKYIRDTWDDPTGVIGGWDMAEHGEYVEAWVEDGQGI